MADNVPTLPPFARAAVDAITAAKTLSPADKDRRVFEIAGNLLYGPTNYTIRDAGKDLDTLCLPAARRAAVSTFFSGLEEAMADGGLTAQSECWDSVPAWASAIGEQLWAGFRKSPDLPTHKRLLSDLDGTQSTGQSEATVQRDLDDGGTKLSKRPRRPPSHLGNYTTDDENEVSKSRADSHSRKKMRSDSGTPPRVGLPQASSSRQTLSSSASGLGAKKKAPPPEKAGSSTSASLKPKRNVLLGKKDARPLTSAEKRAMRRAQDGKAYDSGE
ncbi:unnamed protein product, partial [Tilletia laevis]